MNAIPNLNSGPWRFFCDESTYTVQPMEGAVVRKTTIFLLHMKRFWVRITGEVNRCIL